MCRKMICFHNPEEPNGYLSNWYLCDFVIDGMKYTSAEQYMMYQKAVLFGDLVIAQKIMSTNHTGEIKAYGRSVFPYDEKEWDRNRYRLVYKGVFEKFRQNEQLAELLLETGDAILAECAVRDTVWGIGLSMKDGRRMDMSEWKGRNLLGKILMQVREELRNEKKGVPLLF